MAIASHSNTTCRIGVLFYCEISMVTALLSTFESHYTDDRLLMCTCFSMCVHVQKDVRKACSIKSIRYWSQFHLMFIKKNAPGFCFIFLNLLAGKGLAIWHFCTPSIYCEHSLQHLLYNYLQYVYIFPCPFCQIITYIKTGLSVACNKIGSILTNS